MSRRVEIETLVVRIPHCDRAVAAQLGRQVAAHLQRSCAELVGSGRAASEVRVSVSAGADVAATSRAIADHVAGALRGDHG